MLHSLNMWLIVSSLLTHYLHLLFCCVLSILALIWLVLIALFCVAIRGDLVSLLRFSFLCHVQVIEFFTSLEFESFQVSRTLLSIQDNLNIALVWILSARLSIFNFTCPFRGLFRGRQLQMVSLPHSFTIASLVIKQVQVLLSR